MQALVDFVSRMVEHDPNAEPEDPNFEPTPPAAATVRALAWKIEKKTAWVSQTFRKYEQKIT